MSYESALIAEINAILDRLAADNLPLRAQWIAHEICKAHEDGLGEGEDRLFWQHCGYNETRDVVRRCINRRTGDDRKDDEHRQLTLPGYEHVQHYYMVKREGEEIGVSIHDMTDAELIDKANSYRDMAAACYAHADEIDRFRSLRTPNLPLLDAADLIASHA
jgi:hypothetical protein